MNNAKQEKGKVSQKYSFNVQYGKARQLLAKAREHDKNNFTCKKDIFTKSIAKESQNFRANIFLI